MNGKKPILIKLIRKGMPHTLVNLGFARAGQLRKRKEGPLIGGLSCPGPAVLSSDTHEPDSRNRLDTPKVMLGATETHDKVVPVVDPSKSTTAHATSPSEKIYNTRAVEAIDERRRILVGGAKGAGVLASRLAGGVAPP